MVARKKKFSDRTRFAARFDGFLHRPFPKKPYSYRIDIGNGDENVLSVLIEELQSFYPSEA